MTNERTENLSKQKKLTDPLGVTAVDDLVDCHVHSQGGNGEDVEGKEDEELLVLLAHTVVHPWTVMVHLDYASFTNTVG